MSKLNLFERECDKKIAELTKENDALKSHIERLTKSMSSIRDDLLMRADIDYDGKRVVNCGSTAWEIFNDTIDATPAQSLAEVKREAIIKVTQESLNDLDIKHVTPARKEYVKQGILLLAKTIEQNANKLLSEVE